MIPAIVSVSNESEYQLKFWSRYRTNAPEVIGAGRRGVGEGEDAADRHGIGPLAHPTDWRREIEGAIEGVVGLRITDVGELHGSAGQRSALELVVARRVVEDGSRDVC